MSAVQQLVGDGKVIAHAAVFAHQDQVMGYSPNMYAAGLAADPNIDYAGEVNNLNAALGNPSLAQASGIKAGGIKYMFIRSHVQDGSSDPFLTGNKVRMRCSVNIVLFVAVVLMLFALHVVACPDFLAHT